MFNRKQGEGGPENPADLTFDGPRCHKEPHPDAQAGLDRLVAMVTNRTVTWLRGLAEGMKPTELHNQALADQGTGSS